MGNVNELAGESLATNGVSGLDLGAGHDDEERPGSDLIERARSVRNEMLAVRSAILVQLLALDKELGIECSHDVPHGKMLSTAGTTLKGSLGPFLRLKPARVPKAGVSKPRRTARLARRSPEQIAESLGRIVTLLTKKGEGMRAEHIRDELGLLSKEMPKLLRTGLATKVLKAKGQKRARTYAATGK